MSAIACEWGLAGIEAWRRYASVFVIVDVLSFSTAVSVAIEQGAAVLPFPYGDQAAAAQEAARRGALVAYPRAAGGGQLSLSPVSLMGLDAGARVLLPSPNGARLSLATGDVTTLCGCLRNAAAAARLAAEIAGDGTVVVIAAGERWPDGTMRPAIEDWLGAGAVIAACRGEANAEAGLAADAYRMVQGRLTEVVRDSRSGRELIGWNYGADVDLAVEVDATALVPMMRDGAYKAAAARSID